MNSDRFLLLKDVDSYKSLIKSLNAEVLSGFDI